MLKDLENITDIEVLVQAFYTKVQKDDTIGYIFNDVANVNWDKHFPIMYSFWNSVLFGAASYKGNPMLKHIMLSREEPLQTEHFARWIQLWTSTVDENFEGPKAEEAKSKATSIKDLMMYKVGAVGRMS